MVDREFQAKTNHLVKQQVGSYGVGGLGEIVAIDGNTIELIKNKSGGDLRHFPGNRRPGPGDGDGGCVVYAAGKGGSDLAQ